MIPTSWPSGRRARTAVASAAAVLLSTTLVPGNAWAAPHRSLVTANETTQAVGTWGAAASPTSMSWAVASNAHQTTTVSNTGTVAITAMTYKVVVSGGLGLGTSFTLAGCSTPWVGGLCSGGAGTPIGGTYGTGSTTNVTSTFVPALGGDIYLQATASGLPCSG